MKDNALVVVDMLYDFIDGNMACIAADKAVAGTLAYIEEATAGTDPDNSGVRSIFPILFVRDSHPADHSSFQEQGGPWPSHCVQGTHGADIHEALAPYAAEDLCFYKGMKREEEQYSGYEGTNPAGQRLHEVLDLLEIREVVLCGIATEYCVYNTAKDLLDAGFRVSVLRNGLACVDLAGHEATLVRMQQEGMKLIG